MIFTVQPPNKICSFYYYFNYLYRSLACSILVQSHPTTVYANLCMRPLRRGKDLCSRITGSALQLHNYPLTSGLEGPI